MDTKNVLPSAARCTSLSGSSSTGTLLIRAPPTLDDDYYDDDDDDFYSDFEPKPPRIDIQYGTNCSDESSERGSDCERLFASGDDFETASERPFVADPDEKTLEGGEGMAEDRIFRPFVVHPDVNKIENSFREEMCSDVDEYSSVAETLAVYDHEPVVDQVMPIARLTIDFENEEGLMAIEDSGDDENRRAVRVPGFDVSEMVGSAPRIRVVVDEEERDEGETTLFVGDGIEIHSTSGEYNSENGDLASMGHVRVMPLKGEEVSFMEQNSLMLANFEYLSSPGRRIEDADHHRSNDERVWELSDTDFAEKCETNTASRAMQLNFEELDFSRCKIMQPSFKCAVEEPVVGKVALYDRGLTLEDQLNDKTPHLQIVSKGPEVAGEVKHLDYTDYKNGSKDNQEASAINIEMAEANEMSASVEALHDPRNLLKSVFMIAPSDHEPELEGSDAENEAIDETGEGEKSLPDDGEVNNLTFSSSEMAQLVTTDLEDEFTSSVLSNLVNSQVYPAIFDGHIVSESTKEQDSYVYGGQNLLVDLGILGDLLEASSCAESEENLSKGEKKRLEDVYLLKVKLLRLVYRLGYSPKNSIATQALYRLALTIGSQSSQAFHLRSAKKLAVQLEAEGGSIDLSLNILVIGKTGVGKSATINTVLGEKKAVVSAFEPATVTVKEILENKDGVKFRFIDTPGLKSSGTEQSLNKKILLSIKKFTKRFPPDVVMYVDRLDCPTSDLIDLPILQSITNLLGSIIWHNAIIVLTHASSTPLDGPTGSPFSYEDLVAQRSSVIRQCVGSAIGDRHAMNPSPMLPVLLVENHLSEKNEPGCAVRPSGQCWRTQLLILCYSLKILSEASPLSKLQASLDLRKIHDFCVRSFALLVVFFIATSHSPKTFHWSG